MASTLAGFESSGFLPVGTLKTHAYAAPVDNEETHRTVDACPTTRNCPGVFERIRWSMMRRVKACIEISRRTF
jgi:hypothetical protein